LASVNTYYVSSDNIIDSGKPNEYKKCSTYGDMGSWNVYGGNAFRYLAKINLNGLTSATKFDKAVFKIDRVSNTWDDDNNYVLRKITSDWNQNSVTWNSQPRYSSTAIRVKVGSYGMYEFDVTDIVKEWLNNPSTNYGFVIKKEVENTSLENHKGSFACSDYPVLGAENAPVLEISSGATSQSPLNKEDLDNDAAAILSSLSKADIYKAIVKIFTISVNQDYELSQNSYGSGVLISSDGLILTNSHVVTVDDSYDGTDEVAGYNVCLNASISEVPDCSYKARLIAKDEKIDIALLKIEKVPGLSGLDVFLYANFSASDPVVGDEVFAMWFPFIGGETVTVTKGVVSGRLNKYSHDWSKTDAVISFGSSGGAALNSKGELVGITSGAYSDLVGDMGYFINLKSLNSWINFNKIRSALIESPLLSQLNNFIIKRKQANLSNTFKMDKANISITKPTGWDFSVNSEGLVWVDKKSDDAGGSIAITFKKYPFSLGQASISHVWDIFILWEWQAELI